MKKIILFVWALMGAVQILSAVPALPGPFTRTLPDGRKITLQLHGDEFRHWMTDASGQVVKEDGRGFIVPSSMAETETLLGGGAEVNRTRTGRLESTRRMMRRAAPARASVPALHFPLILVQFPDLPFSVAETDELVWKAFDDLANEVGYSANGGTGSIHDFYVDNSLGQTDFYFDVFGPVTVSQPYAYYGSTKEGPSGAVYEAAAEALMEAVRIIAAEQGDDVFNPYDNDGNGKVDAVLMFYAGFNEAEGGPSDTIWPHEWAVGGWDPAFSQEVFGNVRFSIYSCASEKKGSPDYDRGMCGIGTAVHEFGHALGLPDLYDTNYNNYGDGQTGGVYTFSPMCNGSYNNNGRTPSYFTMEERIMMGWADGFTPMPASGTITIPSVDTNFAYVEETDNPGEYFVFECRKGTGWDAYTPSGMVVYHVDKSDNEVFVYTGPGEGYVTTAADIWRSHRGNINTWLEHPCYITVPAPLPESCLYPGNYSDIPFPGDKRVTTYRWQGWDPDNRQADEFFGISFDRQAGTVTLRREGVDTAVAGKVTDTEGNPVAGAAVRVYAGYYPEGATLPAPSAVAGGPARIAAHVGEPLQTEETDENGLYLADLEGVDLDGAVTVEVSAPGFVTRTERVTLRERAIVNLDVQVRRIGQPVYSSLMKYDGRSGSSFLGFNITEPTTQMAAIRFTAGELAPFAGCKVAGLEFVFNQGEEASLTGVKGIIDFGDERVLVQDLPSYASGVWNHLDLSGEDIVIPEDTECCFGYALLDCPVPYPYYVSLQSPVEGGLLLCYGGEESVLDRVGWWDYSDIGFGPLLISVILENGAVLRFNYIRNPEGGTYEAGSTLDLDLVQVSGDQAPGTAVDWYYDDEPVSGTVTFSEPGRHVLEARFTTVAGRRRIVELEITVL